MEFDALEEFEKLRKEKFRLFDRWKVIADECPLRRPEGAEGTDVDFPLTTGRCGVRGENRPPRDCLYTVCPKI